MIPFLIQVAAVRSRHRLHNFYILMLSFFIFITPGLRQIGAYKSRGGAAVAYENHSLEVGGSNPSHATDY